MAEVRCRITTPGSLVAMKLQSAPKRRAARAEKAGGDYLDLFRLTSHPDMTRTIAEALRQAPHDLGSWCQQEIKRCMVDKADRTVGTIVRSGPGWGNRTLLVWIRCGARGSPSETGYWGRAERLPSDMKGSSGSAAPAKALAIRSRWRAQSCG